MEIGIGCSFYYQGIEASLGWYSEHVSHQESPKEARSKFLLLPVSLHALSPRILIMPFNFLLCDAWASWGLLTPEGLLLPGLANIPFRDSNVLFMCKPTDPEPVTPATFAVGLSHSGPLSTHPNHQKAVHPLSRLRLCNPMNCSMPGLPVHHQLPEPAQIRVHQVGDAIQPSDPLSSPSPPALNLPQPQGLFKWVSSSHQVATVMEFQLQHQSFQWTPRIDLL